MSSVSDILQLESLNRTLIYLHKEGVFWKAYQRSAYLFLQHYGAYKTSKKYVKVVKQEVVSLGFPDGVFQKLFSESAAVHKIDDKQVYVCCKQIDEEEYKAWFASVPLKIATVTASESEPKALKMYAQGVDEVITNEQLIIDELRAFRLESATPMCCMNFVHTLKKLL